MRYLLTLAMLAVAVEAQSASRPLQAPLPPQAPPVRPACVCGTGCTCPPGVCPGKCPVAKEPAPSPTAFRAPHGHTHTCSRCGTTWDHDANPSHTCQRCGSAQYVQDVVPRPVPVAAVRYTLPTATSSWSVTGGCANGRCNLPRR